MEEEDYIKLDELLAKLRVVCLKSLSQNEQYAEDKNVMKMIRKENEKNLKIIRNINYIRTNMPLQIGEGTISIIK